MKSTGVARFAGACAAVGGAAWTAASIIHASQPRGCVGDECAAWQMREATTVTSLLIALSAVMLVASGVGLVVLTRRQGRLGRTGVIGASAAGLGITVLVLAVALQGLFFGQDFRWMPAFVVPGVTSLAAGLALLGWTVLRSRVLPAWLALWLIVGAVLLVGANEQTAAVLLALPFGVAWLATGAALLVHRSEETPRDHSADVTSAIR